MFLCKICWCCAIILMVLHIDLILYFIIYEINVYSVWLRFSKIFSIGDRWRNERTDFRKKNKLPNYILACTGGGSNAIGAFYSFIPEKQVKL